MLNTHQRKARVAAFRELCLRANFTELAPLVFERDRSFQKTLTLCTLIHGNEIGGLEVLIHLLEDLLANKLSLKSNLRLILGNVEAYYAEKRFLETDLNRSFGLDEPETSEELRAREIEEYFRTSDVLIDIHQTIGRSATPFFIFEYEQGSYNLARYLHPTLPIVTHNKERPFKGKTSTAFSIGEGALAITIETGQKGIEPGQIELGLNIVRKAIETDFQKTIPSGPMSNTFSFHQIIHNPDGRLELIRQLENFDTVTKGEVLARNAASEVLSEVDGVVLFAKYGAYAKSSPELALILKAVHSVHDF